MIDWGRVDELREEVGEEDLVEVIDMFCEEVEEVLAGLASASSAELPGQIHFLKGSAQNIGISSVSDLCKSFEDAMRSDSAFTPDIAGLVSAFGEARTALSQRLGLN